MIIPIGISEGDWFDFTSQDLSQYGVLPRYEGNWKDCANLWLQNPNLTGKQIPRPDSFDQFEDWASRFNQSIFG